VRRSNLTSQKRSLPDQQGKKNPQSDIISSDPMASDRIEFPKSGKRDDGARVVAYHLLCPDALTAYAMACKEGEVKYGARNWEKGIPTENYIDHALAHIIQAMRRYQLDGSRLTELSHALWNIAAAIHNETGCTHHDWKD
jgi:hypothetical protein